MHHTPPIFRRRSVRGFTLVELMISLGIAILLIYGVNLVFRAVADTVRSGNSLAVAGRKMRSVESALTIDFEGTFEERDPTSPTGATGKQQQLERRWSGITPVLGDITNGTGTLYDKQPRQPAITIFCKRQGAFFNKADLERNSDQAGADATNPYKFDELENGTVVDFGLPAQYARVGDRIHRVDTIGFFSGGSFAAHAVPFGNSLIGGEAPQAWVWYGHLLQHESLNNFAIAKYDELLPMKTDGTPGTARFYQPGQDAPVSNHRNYFAGDWVLGRMAMTLLPRKNSSSGNPGVPILGVAPGRSVYQVFTESPPTPPNSPTANPTGIAFGATERKASADSSTYETFPSGSTDDRDQFPVDAAVPAASAVPFTSGLRDAVGIWLGVPGTTSETKLPTGSVGTLKDTPSAPIAYDQTKFSGLVYRYWKLQEPASTEKKTWWQRSMIQPDPAVTWPMRFNTVSAFSKPVIDDSKVGLGRLTPLDKSSLQSTYLAKGCTQFIVEFAGDFVTQAANGKVAPATMTPDGVLDFDIDPVSGIRRTQWYGMPRDVNGDGVAAVDANSGAGGDVVPIFEKMGGAVPTIAASDKSVEKEYVAGDRYIVAFGPNDMYPNTKFQKDSIRPWLIRLTVVIGDSNGSLPSGLSREFVFKVR